MSPTPPPPLDLGVLALGLDRAQALDHTVALSHVLETLGTNTRELLDCGHRDHIPSLAPLELDEPLQLLVEPRRLLREL
eukprot:8475402-Alexandrium_andersonii.AAC.1